MFVNLACINQMSAYSNIKVDPKDVQLRQVSLYLEVNKIKRKSNVFLYSLSGHMQIQ
jgi:hypothetical protein